MRAGLITPVVTLNPRIHNAWERSATVDDLITVVQAADRLGYRHVTCSEHIAVPSEVAAFRGSRYYDPLATLAFFAARTERVRLATHVLVLGYHHPLEIAKRYGTLDLLSGGRVILGVGVGTLEPEFALLGAPYEDRGDRADESLRALRAALSQRAPSYAGEYVSFDGVVVEPHAVQDHVPLWVGGKSERSLRRAVELGDAWVPHGPEPESLAPLVARAQRTDAWAARMAPLDIVLGPEPALDPLGDPIGTVAALHRVHDAGATVVNLRLVHDSVDHCVEQLDAMVRLGTESGELTFA